MIEKFKNWNIKKWILTLIAMLLITDIVILLNIPFLREVLAFIYFSTVPGILILHILRLNSLEFIKKTLLSVGLSISFIIFTGIFLNSLYPLLFKPLSLVPVLISFNVLLIIMAIIAYNRNKETFVLKEFLNFEINSEDKLISMLIFSVLFPFMAIFGTYLMNNAQNNIILISMLLLIPIYLIMVVYFRNKVSNNTFPLSLWMISLALLLMHGLTSMHIMGRDVHSEFYCYNLALDGLHWDLMEYYNPYNACLSVKILPVIYTTLTNLNGEYIFKLFFALIGSIIPVVIYVASKKYVGRLGGFLAALLFVSQTYFIYILGMVRQEIAFLFFFFVILVLFEQNISKTSKKILIVVLMLSVLISHYSTAYFGMVIILPILFLPFLKSLKDYVRNIKKSEKIKIRFKNFDLIFILFALITVWYLLVAKVQAEASNYVMGSTITALAGTSTAPVRDKAVLSVLGIGLSSVPNTMSIIINDLVFLVIAVGFLTLLWQFKSRNKFPFNIEDGFFIGTFLSICLLISFIVLPYLSVAYGPQRLFLQLLVFFAPIFVVGGYSIAKIIKRPKLCPWILVIIIISLFACGTYLQYHFYGIQYSPYYDKDSAMYNEHYIYNQEILATSWLKNNEMKDIKIQADGIAYSRIMRGYNNQIPSYNGTKGSYLYLGYANLIKKLLYDNIENPSKITDFNLFISGRDRIYDNGGSEILINQTK